MFSDTKITHNLDLQIMQNYCKKYLLQIKKIV